MRVKLLQANAGWKGADVDKIRSGWLTDLQVRRTIDNKSWILTQPMIWQGDWEIFYIKPGFTTDFASVPRAVRWLLDSGGKNAAAGVLHDVMWRESKGDPADRRIDPWHADGMFRRALRVAGVGAVPRNMLWVGVRVAATFSGRLGQRGPSLGVKAAKMIGWTTLALLVIGVPLIAILLGYLVYLLIDMVIQPLAVYYRRRKTRNDPPDKAFAITERLAAEESPAHRHCADHLLVIPTIAATDPNRAQLLVDSDENLHSLLQEYLAEIEEHPHAHWREIDVARRLQIASQCEQTSRPQPAATAEIVDVTQTPTPGDARSAKASI